MLGGLIFLSTRLNPWGEVVQGLNIVSECISVSQVIDALVEKGEIFTCSGGVVALGLEYPSTTELNFHGTAGRFQMTRPASI